MRIRIAHEIGRRFSPPARSIIQNLRLTPRSHEAQYVLSWRVSLDVDGALRQSEDALGNLVHSFSRYGPLDGLTILAEGEVETADSVGVVRGAVEPLPAEMFLRASPMAQIGGALRDFAAQAVAGAATPLEKLHRLMAALHALMNFDPLKTDEADDAAAAFALRRGGCRDYVHVFVACARWLGIPARFVRGYVAPSEDFSAPGLYAWAEAYDPVLGWVAFDPVAKVCADERYVRVIVGFDGQDCAAVRSAHSGGEERSESAVTVEQAGGQSQG